MGLKGDYPVFLESILIDYGVQENVLHVSPLWSVFIDSLAQWKKKHGVKTCGTGLAVVRMMKVR